MKNKKFLIGIVSFLALGASTLGVVVGQSANVPMANGSQAVYSMTLNNINKVTSAEATAKSFTRQTALGNNISFALSNFNYRSEAEYFGQISSGDTDRWIRNSSAMNGISKITINYDIKASGGSFKVGGSSSYGSYADYQTYSADAESNKTKIFTFETPVTYFSIENNTSKCGLYIRSLTVEYSCVLPSVEVEEKNSKDLLYYSTDEYDNFIILDSLKI